MRSSIVVLTCCLCVVLGEDAEVEETRSTAKRQSEFDDFGGHGFGSFGSDDGFAKGFDGAFGGQDREQTITVTKPNGFGDNFEGFGDYNAVKAITVNEPSGFQEGFDVEEFGHDNVKTINSKITSIPTPVPIPQSYNKLVPIPKKYLAPLPYKKPYPVPKNYAVQYKKTYPVKTGQPYFYPTNVPYISSYKVPSTTSYKVPNTLSYKVPTTLPYKVPTTLPYKVPASKSYSTSINKPYSAKITYAPVDDKQLGLFPGGHNDEKGFVEKGFDFAGQTSFNSGFDKF